MKDLNDGNKVVFTMRNFDKTIYIKERRYLKMVVEQVNLLDTKGRNCTYFLLGRLIDRVDFLRIGVINTYLHMYLPPVRNV